MWQHLRRSGSLPYDTMQSCASHASTSSLVRYDDASEGEWPL
ncbi:MAG: hypothetical protein ACLR8Y_16945 [Alistipes indistinctus]